FQEHKRYTLAEADTIPALAPVVQRLKERIVEHAARRAHD
ncbi:thymidylate kinase, partial [Salmonella enterica subsp. enterica serovar Typhimurium]